MACRSSQGVRRKLMAINTNLSVDEDSLIGTLISLTLQKQFRTAWSFLENNIDPRHIRVQDAGILLQGLSHNYGDIGNLKDECLLKKELQVKAEQVIKLLV